MIDNLPFIAAAFVIVWGALGAYVLSLRSRGRSERSEHGG